MRLRHIEVLVTVSEVGSLRGAARKLGLTQPALSKAIRQMEADLHVPMLTRTSRGVVLTDYGRAVLTRARNIHSELRRMNEEVAQLSGKMRGSVSIAVAPLPSLLILPHVLPRFCAQHPEIEVRIVDGIFPTVLPMVREGAFDFTVGPAPPDRAAGEFDMEELMRTELAVVGRVGHPKTRARRLSDLVSERWITLGPSQGPGDYFVDAFRAHGLDPPKATIKSESFASSLALLEASDFLSVLPQRLVAQVEKQERIKALAVPIELPTIKVVLLRRAGVPFTPAAEALATLIRRRANTLAGPDPSSR